MEAPLATKQQPVTEKNSLYASAPKIQPKSVRGPFRKRKDVFLWIGLILYHLTPLLRWDRGPNNPSQAIQFDINAQRIYLFDLEVWPQDIYILTGLMIFAAIALFLSAALWGRAWCGFGCFQTLWTDLFRKVEALIEGDRNARIKLDLSKTTAEKVLKRTLKHGIWLIISAFFALSFLWYFGDSFETTHDILDGQLSGWSLATFVTLWAMTYLMAGFAREQVCFYMCPYGRFQGTMQDQHSQVITYENWRGEKRQKADKDRNFENRGHCVDCTLCVQVCPTGIDIRNGNQMECIGCGLCIDACDQVMTKLNLPTKLISYDSQYNIEKRASHQDLNVTRTSNILRPRTIIYMFILMLTIGATALGFSSREMTKITILKDRAPLFIPLSDGDIQNAYTIRLVNKETQHRRFLLQARASFQPQLKIIGSNDNHIHLKAGSISTHRVYVKTPQPASSLQPITFELIDLSTDQTYQNTSVFHSPERTR